MSSIDEWKKANKHEERDGFPGVVTAAKVHPAYESLLTDLEAEIRVCSQGRRFNERFSGPAKDDLVEALSEAEDRGFVEKLDLSRSDHLIAGYRGCPEFGVPEGWNVVVSKPSRHLPDRYAVVSTGERILRLIWFRRWDKLLRGDE